MPELPEVETVVRRLNKRLCGEQISDIKVLRQKSWQGEIDQVIGKQITQVDLRAKLIHIRISQDNLIIHLKMTGQLILVDGDKRIGGGHPTPDWVQALPSRHTRVIINFVSGKHSILMTNGYLVGLNWLLRKR